MELETGDANHPAQRRIRRREPANVYVVFFIAPAWAAHVRGQHGIEHAPEVGGSAQHAALRRPLERLIRGRRNYRLQQRAIVEVEVELTGDSFAFPIVSRVEYAERQCQVVVTGSLGESIRSEIVINRHRPVGVCRRIQRAVPSAPDMSEPARPDVVATPPATRDLVVCHLAIVLLGVRSRQLHVEEIVRSEFQLAGEMPGIRSSNFVTVGRDPPVGAIEVLLEDV